MTAYTPLWALPPAFFDGATVASLQGNGYRATHVAEGAAGEPVEATARGDASAVGRVDLWAERGFSSVDEWRAHTRSDLFRLNAGRRAAGRAPLSEAEFERLVADGGEVSSIEASGESDDGLAVARPPSGELAAKVVFSTPDGSLFAVWRAALASAREEKEDSAWARAGPASPAPGRLRALRASPGTWLLLLARGGHFAALVVRMSAVPAAGLSSALPPPAILAQRTFHRYVVRAKQGGRQAAADGAKSIKSVGSSLRRANEAALQRDVRALLQGEWAAHVAGCHLIWLALSDADRRTVVGGEGAPVQRDDARIRRVPFATRRPTAAEAQRVARMLAAVQTGIAAAPEEAAAARAEPPPVAEPEEETGSSGSERDAQEAAAAAAAADPRAGDTPLHTAARAGDAAAVAQLLQAGADPGTRNVRGRVAYSVARDRVCRDAFRRARAAAEGAWDWGAAGVTSALTPQMEAAGEARRAAARDAERAKERARRKAAKDRRRAAEAAAAAEAEAEAAREARDAAELQAALTGAHARRRRHAALTLPPPGARSKAAALLHAASAAEQATREARAAAAERRMAALGLGGAGGGGGAAPQGRCTAAAPDPTAAAALSRSIGAAPSAAVSAAAGPFGAPAAPAFGASLAVGPAAPAAHEAALLALCAAATAAQAGLLERVLRNAASDPADARKRRLRLSNPLVADALLASGALATLLHPFFGWETEGAGEEAAAVLAEGVCRQHAAAMLAAAGRLKLRADA